MFTFKRFHINQERCAMKVGTDGVLLGAWCSAPEVCNILDIGTGTGLIALMAAQRSPHAHIDAIEIDEEAARQADENRSNSPFAEQITIYPIDLVTFSKTKLGQYDLIVCNPPFFVNSLKTPNTQRTLARHNDSLPFDILASNASKLLKSEGLLELILPPLEGEQFVQVAQAEGLYLTHITYVYPTPESDIKRVLLRFKKHHVELSTSSLMIELSRHNYSEEFKTLTKDFYLKH